MIFWMMSRDKVDKATLIWKDSMVSDVKWLLQHKPPDGPTRFLTSEVSYAVLGMDYDGKSVHHLTPEARRRLSYNLGAVHGSR